VRLGDSYDVPEEIARGPHSPTFAKFLRNWFGDTYALTHGELDITFLNGLTPEELTTARELIRRNLKLRQVHIIEGTSALHDVDAAPMLRAMLDRETSDDWRLTIAGALWKLTKDPVFIDCLDRAKAGGGALARAHMNKILWLADGRAIDWLIDLLPEEDGESAFWRIMRYLSFRRPFRPLLARLHIAHVHATMTGSFALQLLNQLEAGRMTLILPQELEHQPSDYRRRRNDPAFREAMVAAIHRWNAQMKNGR